MLVTVSAQTEPGDSADVSAPAEVRCTFVDEAVATSYGQLATAVAQVGRQPRSRVMDLQIAANAHAEAPGCAPAKPQTLSGSRGFSKSHRVGRGRVTVASWLSEQHERAIHGTNATLGVPAEELARYANLFLVDSALHAPSAGTGDVDFCLFWLLRPLTFSGLIPARFGSFADEVMTNR